MSASCHLAASRPVWAVSSSRSCLGMCFYSVSLSLEAQRAIVIKLSRGWSVSRCVCLSSALWKNSGSDPDAVWHHRSDGSRDEARSGLWRSVHGKGYFWGWIWANFAATWPSSQITLGRLVIVLHKHCFYLVSVYFTAQLLWHATVLCSWCDITQYWVGTFTGRWRWEKSNSMEIQYALLIDSGRLFPALMHTCFPAPWCYHFLAGLCADGVVSVCAC